MLQSFAVYAVGFLVRPIGAATFGDYGGRIGRKAALITTLLLTGLATFAVGFVPTYQPSTPGGNSSIGRWATLAWVQGLYRVVFPPCTLCGLR